MHLLISKSYCLAERQFHAKDESVPTNHRTLLPQFLRPRCYHLWREWKLLSWDSQMLCNCSNKFTFFKTELHGTKPFYDFLHGDYCEKKVSLMKTRHFNLLSFLVHLYIYSSLLIYKDIFSNWFIIMYFNNVSSFHEYI